MFTLPKWQTESIEFDNNERAQIKSFLEGHTGKKLTAYIDQQMLANYISAGRQGATPAAAFLSGSAVGFDSAWGLIRSLSQLQISENKETNSSEAEMGAAALARKLRT